MQRRASQLERIVYTRARGCEVTDIQFGNLLDTSSDWGPSEMVKFHFVSNTELADV